VYLCVSCDSTKIATISLKSTNLFVFRVDAECVLFAREKNFKYKIYESR
jgi:hypothetical protein